MIEKLLIGIYILCCIAAIVTFAVASEISKEAAILWPINCLMWILFIAIQRYWKRGNNYL